MSGFVKRISLLLCCFVLSAGLFITVSAHPGGSNSDGGHWDHDTGEYHYHHGYPAHDHYDSNGDGIIDCPYDFDDQSGVNSGISSGGNSYSIHSYSENSSPQIVTVYKDREVVKEVPVTPTWVKWALGISICCLVGCFWYNSNRNYALKKELDSQISLRDQSEKESKNYLSQFNTDAAKTFGNSYLYRLCETPHGDYIGSDNLPAAFYGRDHKWGEKYTFYVSRTRFGSTNKLHKASCRYARYQNPVNAYTLHKWSSLYSPCLICNPEVPNMTWVDKYLEYKMVYKKHGVEIPKVDLVQEVGSDPYMGFVTQEMLKSHALEMGVSLQTAILIINQKRKLYGIPELDIKHYQT